MDETNKTNDLQSQPANISRGFEIDNPKQQKILEYDVEDLIAKAEEYAFTNISDWNLIKEAISECKIESVMQTHALEITATFKNGEEIIAREPKIDDIFDIINEYKDKCGEIRMATE